jgi:vitamin K-dependent gamma-carboxylase-like protein
VRALKQAWDRFWFADVSAEPMGLMRIAFGAIVLAYWLSRWPDATDLYSLRAQGRFGWPIPSPGVAHFLFALLCGSAFAFMIGYRTRLANFILLGTYGYLLAIGREIIWAYDRVMLLILAVLLCGWPGAAFSVDAWRARRASPEEAGLEPTRPIFGVRLLYCALSAIYFFSGLTKLVFSPHWHDGSLLLMAMLDRGTAVKPVGVLLTKAPIVVLMLAQMTWIWELLFPAGALWRRTAPWWLAAGVAFHLGIQSTIDVGPFNAVMIAAMIGIIRQDLYVRFKHFAQRASTVFASRNRRLAG